MQVTSGWLEVDISTRLSWCPSSNKQLGTGDNQGLWSHGGCANIGKGDGLALECFPSGDKLSNLDLLMRHALALGE